MWHCCSKVILYVAICNNRQRKGANVIVATCILIVKETSYNNYSKKENRYFNLKIFINGEQKLEVSLLVIDKDLQIEIQI